MTADDIRKARQDRVASALAKANTKTGLFKRPGTTAVADPYPDQATVAPGHTDLMVSPEAIHEFIEANPPPAPATGWQPIETAPKDGTPLLLHAPSLIWADDWGADDPKSMLVGSWRKRGLGGNWELAHYDAFTYSPTHWMPLPEPPND